MSNKTASAALHLQHEHPPCKAREIRKALTIGIVSSASAPRQDIVGIRLHRATIVLSRPEPCRVGIRVPTLDNGDFRKSIGGTAHE